MLKLPFDVFVIHVSSGYEEREKHINDHLPNRGIMDFDYMLEGDIKDLSDEIQCAMFADDKLSLAEKSCFYKHYLVYKKMVDESIAKVLVLEDDVYLCRNFLPKIKKIIKELNGKCNFLVNIEAANLSVPFFHRKFGQFLYLANTTKMAGGYLIDLAAAKKIIKYLDVNKADLPIDVFQSEKRDEIKLNIYWSQPYLVEQGSKNGRFSSSVNDEKKGYKQKIHYYLKKWRKEYLFSHVNKRVTGVFKDVKYHQ